MLGHPIAVIAKHLSMLGQIGGIGQRLPDGSTFDHRHKIEHGKGGYGHLLIVGQQRPLRKARDRLARKRCIIR